jgi:hypothetical protein
MTQVWDPNGVRVRNDGLPPTTLIWAYNRRLSWRLMRWALASIAVGMFLARSRRAFWRAFGWQTAAWGAVDVAIAGFGQLKSELDQGSATTSVERLQARKLRRLLWINAALDVGYVLAAVILARRTVSEPMRRQARQGHAAAIASQGAFLFAFDLLHARRVPPIERGGDRI